MRKRRVPVVGIRPRWLLPCRQLRPLVRKSLALKGESLPFGIVVFITRSPGGLFRIASGALDRNPFPFQFKRRTGFLKNFPVASHAFPFPGQGSPLLVQFALVVGRGRPFVDQPRSLCRQRVALVLSITESDGKPVAFHPEGVPLPADRVVFLLPVRALPAQLVTLRSELPPFIGNLRLLRAPFEVARLVLCASVGARLPLTFQFCTFSFHGSAKLIEGLPFDVQPALFVRGSRLQSNDGGALVFQSL
jgi:hypothetical protein